MTSAPFSTPPSDPPAAQQPPVRPQLRRSGTEKMFGGVCGGLAEYSGIDPLLWRVGFVGLTLAGGAGVIVYLLLWVLMPSGPLRPGDSPSAIDRLVDKLHGAASGAGMTPRGD
jgi:phage shock protein PspC (stress-responsive transcriptional regulator)